MQKDFSVYRRGYCIVCPTLLILHKIYFLGVFCPQNTIANRINVSVLRYPFLPAVLLYQRLNQQPGITHSASLGPLMSSLFFEFESSNSNRTFLEAVHNNKYPNGKVYAIFCPFNEHFDFGLNFFADCKGNIFHNRNPRCILSNSDGLRYCLSQSTIFSDVYFLNCELFAREGLNAYKIEESISNITQREMDSCENNQLKCKLLKGKFIEYVIRNIDTFLFPIYVGNQNIIGSSSYLNYSHFSLLKRFLFYLFHIYSSECSSNNFNNRLSKKRIIICLIGKHLDACSTVKDNLLKKLENIFPINISKILGGLIEVKYILSNDDIFCLQKKFDEEYSRETLNITLFMEGLQKLQVDNTNDEAFILNEDENFMKSKHLCEDVFNMLRDLADVQISKWWNHLENYNYIQSFGSLADSFSNHMLSKYRNATKLATGHDIRLEKFIELEKYLRSNIEDLLMRQIRNADRECQKFLKSGLLLEYKMNGRLTLRRSDWIYIVKNVEQLFAIKVDDLLGKSGIFDNSNKLKNELLFEFKKNLRIYANCMVENMNGRIKFTETLENISGIGKSNLRKIEKKRKGIKCNFSLTALIRNNGFGNFLSFAHFYFGPILCTLGYSNDFDSPEFLRIGGGKPSFFRIQP